MTAEPWLSARELAPRIGVSVTTVRRLGDSLPRTLVGHQWRYIESEVKASLRGEDRRAEVVALRGEGRAA